MIMTERRRVDVARVDLPGLVGRLRRWDLRGHGGAGFPVATKIDSARGRRSRLIVNACDGEPLVDKDAAVLRHAAGLLVDGINLVRALTDAREVIIAVHASSAGDADAISRQTGGRTMIVPDRYVGSEASALASLAAGGEALPAYHERPLTHGGAGRKRVPTLVFNAETLARVAAVALGEPPATRLITLAGAVSRPGLVETGLGSRIGDLVRTFGTPRAVLFGGYGGRWRRWDDVVPRTLADLGSDLGAGLIMVAGPECPVPAVGLILTYLAQQSAGQCGPCVFGLPAVATDWAELAHPGTAAAARERLARRLPVIERRGACSHPDGAVTMATSALEVFAEHLGDHATGRCAATLAAAA